MKKAPRWLLVAQFLLMAIAMVLLAFGLLCFLFGIAGLFGRVMDGSRAENRQLGLQFMGLSLGCVLPALAAFLLSVGLPRIVGRNRSSEGAGTAREVRTPLDSDP